MPSSIFKTEPFCMIYMLMRMFESGSVRTVARIWLLVESVAHASLSTMQKLSVPQRSASMAARVDMGGQQI